MQTMSDNDFDKLFREKFESFEREPSSSVWSGITGKLDGKKAKRRFPTLWLSAASIVLVLGLGLMLFPEKETIKLHGKASNNVSQSEGIKAAPGKVVISEVLENDLPPVPHEDVNRETTLAVKPAKVEATRNILNEGSIKAYSSEQKVEEPAKADIEDLSLIAQNNHDLTPSSEVEKMDLSLNINTNIPDSSELKHRQKIKTVGDLVNFVVSKVDKRKNKIIEFSREDEGDIVSGLNLGLLQYRTRNN